MVKNILCHIKQIARLFCYNIIDRNRLSIPFFYFIGEDVGKKKESVTKVKASPEREVDPETKFTGSRESFYSISITDKHWGTKLSEHYTSNLKFSCEQIGIDYKAVLKKIRNTLNADERVFEHFGYEFFITTLDDARTHLLTLGFNIPSRFHYVHGYAPTNIQEARNANERRIVNAINLFLI